MSTLTAELSDLWTQLNGFRNSVMRSKGPRTGSCEVGMADSHWIDWRMHGLLRRKQPHQHRAERDQLNTHSARTCTNDVSERRRQLTVLHVYSAEKSARKEKKLVNGAYTKHVHTHKGKNTHSQQSRSTSTNRHTRKGRVKKKKKSVKKETQ